MVVSIRIYYRNEIRCTRRKQAIAVNLYVLENGFRFEGALKRGTPYSVYPGHSYSAYLAVLPFCCTKIITAHHSPLPGPLSLCNS
jgi:hypothetical protein